MKSTGTKTPAGETGTKWISEFGPFLTIGMQLAIAVVAFFFLGRWLDGVFGTAPWLMIAGLLLGTAGGFVSFFRSVAAIAKKEESLKHTTDTEREEK